MIELKLDGHTVFQLDVVSQYKDMLATIKAQRKVLGQASEALVLAYLRSDKGSGQEYEEAIAAIQKVLK